MVRPDQTGRVAHRFEPSTTLHGRNIRYVLPTWPTSAWLDDGPPRAGIRLVFSELVRLSRERQAHWWVVGV